MSIHPPFHRHTQTPYILLDTRLCRACWTCVETCPRQVINKAQLFHHKHAHIRAQERCRGCLKCVQACPHGAIRPKVRKNEKELVTLPG